MTIDRLPDVALLEIFDLISIRLETGYLDRGVVQAGARVPKMAKCCFWVTTSPGSQTFLQCQNTSEGNVGRLATLTHRHMGLLR